MGLRGALAGPPGPYCPTVHEEGCLAPLWGQDAPAPWQSGPSSTVAAGLSPAPGVPEPHGGGLGGTGCASCVQCRRAVCVWGRAAPGPVPCCVKPVFLILY